MESFETYRSYLFAIAYRMLGSAMAEVNRQPALIIRAGGRAFLVLTIEVEAQRIHTIRIVVNPEKLARV
jgi:hypothetical protein